MPSMPNLDDLKTVTHSTDIIRVKLLDHTGLGGPMGTERVRQIEQWPFLKAEMAFQFAEVLLSRLNQPTSWDSLDTTVERLRRDFHQNKGRASVDLGAYGVSIEREEQKIVTSFSYQKPVMQEFVVA